MADVYCQPNSDVLKNKLGITNKEELAIAEAKFSFARLVGMQDKALPKNPTYDLKRLMKIHKEIFQDVYDWAGKLRTVDIAKGNYFCLKEHMQIYAISIFEDFYSNCYAHRDDKKSFVKILSSKFADLNALHPFREGNGRTQREFTRQLCLDCGYVLDFADTTKQEMLNASILSFNKGDNTGFHKIFERSLISKKEYEKKKAFKIKYLSEKETPDEIVVKPKIIDYTV